MKTYLRNRLKVPVVLIVAVKTGDETGSENHGVGSLVTTGLEEEDADILVLSKTVGENATGGATTDDNVVVGLLESC